MEPMSQIRDNSAGGIDTRAARQDDLDLLWDFLAIAGYEPDAATARRVPVVAAHLAGWKGPDDFGVIAEREGMACGAAWARQFAPTEGAIFYAGPRTPEVSIGVKRDCRGQGVGALLLRELENAARRAGLDGLCLNVRDTNPAIRLYQRAGYRLMEGTAVRNRVGGLSLGMLLQF
jgi:ribosomal protein S18 acetylase RimI-like enzyme